jgi:hypothetical protein
MYLEAEAEAFALEFTGIEPDKIDRAAFYDSLSSHLGRHMVNGDTFQVTYTTLAGEVSQAALHFTESRKIGYDEFDKLYEMVIKKL